MRTGMLEGVVCSIASPTLRTFQLLALTVTGGRASIKPAGVR